MKEIKKSASFTSKQRGKDVKFNIDLNYSPEYDSFIIKVKEGEGFMAYSSNIERMPLEVIQKLNEMLEEVLIKAGSKTEMMEDLEVELGAEPNPNHSSRSHEGSVKIKTQKVKVKSLTESQNKVREFIEKNDLGAGNFTGGDLFSHGKKIGRVSYNGRVWNLKDEPMKMADGGNLQSGVYAGGGSIKESDIKVGEKFKLMNGEIIEIKRLFTENMDENWVEYTRNGKSHEGSVNSLKIFINNWREGKRKYEFGGDFQSGVYANGGYFDGSIPEVSTYMTNYNKGGAMKNERKHVNHNEDYEVRYAKPRPKRTGYKGKRNFEGGGGVSKFKMLSDKVARNYEGKRVKPQYQKEYGKVYSKSEAKEVGDKVAGKVKAMQKMNTGGATKKGGKGGIMVLAKQIRKEGESWQDAVKRAGQQLK
jgi:hypothetical protein